MIVGKWQQWVAWAITVVSMAFWWFWVADWLAASQSYRLGILYIAVVLITAIWHIRALLRFHKMTKLLRMEEKAGLAPSGSVTFAANQRFRYLMRTIESIIVLIIGVLIIISVHNPGINQNKNYFRLILTYFVGSIVLTGFLTVRDLWVLNVVKKANQDGEDAASLGAVSPHTSTPDRPL